MISDGVCYGMLFDLGVLPEYQKKGVGKGLLNEIMKETETIPLHLTSTSGNEEFYKKWDLESTRQPILGVPLKQIMWSRILLKKVGMNTWGCKICVYVKKENS